MTRSLEELIAAVGDGSWLPVAEMFYTVQGEGAHTGCAAYFVRLAVATCGARGAMPVIRGRAPMPR